MKRSPTFLSPLLSSSITQFSRFAPSRAQAARLGHKLFMSLAALFLLNLAACYDGAWTWVPLDGSPEGTPAEISLDENRSGASETQMSIAIHGYWERPRLGTDRELYTEIRVPGLAALPVPGAPSVPVLTLSLAVPQSQNGNRAPIKAIVDESNVVEIAVEKLWPVVEDATDQAKPGEDNGEEMVSAPENFIIDKQLYASDEAWPSRETVFEAKNGRRLRSIESAEVTLSPVRWNPKGGVMEIVQKMVVTVQHPTEPEPAQGMTPERHKLARLKFKNFGAIGEYYPLAYKYRADFLIIYPNINYEDEIEPLADQKRARGYRVTEMLVSDIGATCTQIRSAIQAWEATRPAWRDAYVLLVGDTNTIPLCSSPTFAPTDDLYASTDGDDLDEEVFLGRLSIDSQSDLANQIDKILTYEDNPDLFCCYNQAALWAHKEGAPGKYEGAHETVRTNTYSTPPVFTTYYGSQVGVEDPDIVNEVDGGVGVLAYRGHGSKYSTATGWNQVSDYFNSSDVALLANPTRKSPVTWSFACSNSDLDESDSIAEIWMEQIGTGSVSYYGATIPSYTSQNHVLDEWMFNAVYDEDLTKQSHAIMRAEDQMASLSGSSNAWMYLLLGDPDMDIRRRNVFNITIWKPPFWFICQSTDCILEFILSKADGSPLTNARVSIWKEDPDGKSDGEIFTNGYTDENGRIELEAAALTTGQIHYTVIGDQGGSTRGSIEVLDPSHTQSQSGRSSEEATAGFEYELEPTVLRF